MAGIGQTARLTRASMVETYRKPFIEMANAYGFPESRIANRYAFRPALVPVLTILGLDLAALLGTIGKRHGRTAGEVAIAWTLRHPAVTGAIVGMRSAQQVDGVIGAAEFRLSADEIAQIERFRAASATPVPA